MRMNFVIASLAALLFLGACSNTLDGAGRDIQHAGQKIQDTF